MLYQKLINHIKNPLSIAIFLLTATISVCTAINHLPQSKDISITSLIDNFYIKTKAETKLFNTAIYINNNYSIKTNNNVTETKHTDIITTPAETIRNLTTGKANSYHYRDNIASRDALLWKQAKLSYKLQKYSQAQQKSETIINSSGLNSISAYWLAGLSAWQQKDYKTAEKHFSTIALNANIDKKLKAEEAASFMFWAYRANKKLGNTSTAQRFLHMGTKYPKSFYGMMAIAKTIQDTPEPQKVATYWKENAKNEWDDGYPIPKWTKRLQRRSDKALVLAIVRQESNFKANAGSNMGAQGLMQILPSTAKYMIKKENALSVQVAVAGKSAYRMLNTPSYNLKAPKYNLTIGQAFLRHLKKRPYIGANLPLIATAYNAGAGNLRRWLKTMDTTDPLLFIESIPITETRNYVKNVARNYWIYDFMLNESTNSAAKIANGIMSNSTNM